MGVINTSGNRLGNRYFATATTSCCLSIACPMGIVSVRYPGDSRITKHSCPPYNYRPHCVYIPLVVR